MRKLTSQELAEPDVELYIPFDLALPDDVKNELIFFGPGVEMRNKHTSRMFTNTLFLPIEYVNGWRITI